MKVNQKADRKWEGPSSESWTMYECFTHTRAESEKIEDK